MTHKEVIQETIDLKDVLGKKVLTKSGKEIGHIQAIYVNSHSLDVDAIKVKKGFFSTDHFIGRGYLSVLNKEGAVLKIDPVEEFVGMEVYDSEGKHLGKVKHVERLSPTNKLISLEVNRGLGKENVIIPAGKIKEVGKNIILSDKADVVIPLAHR